MRMGGDVEEDCEELSLELSIGGKYGKAENLGEKNGEISIWNEPQRRREIQALRRQEARRKREEKVKKSRGNMNIAAGDKLFLEEQRLQGRVGDREIRENDCILEEKSRKNWGGDEDELGLSLFSERKDRENGSLLYPKVQFEEAKNLSDSENSNGVKSLEQCSSAVSDYCSLSPKGGSNADTGGCSHLRQPLERIDSHDSSSPRSSSVEEGMAEVPPQMQMPCVSATGKGPEGRTVTGFLYRYNTREVSIVCVCHGRKHSPVEFVKHAGGVDVSHPLKHITVIMR